MRRSSSDGALCDLQLSGIDDPAVKWAIRWRCVRYLCNHLNRMDVVIVGGAFLLSLVATGLAGRFLPGTFLAGGGTVGLVMPVTLIYRVNYRIRGVLPGILSSLGRCKRCGYRLPEQSPGTCPECGLRVDPAPLRETGDA